MSDYVYCCLWGDHWPPFVRTVLLCSRESYFDPIRAVKNVLCVLSSKGCHKSYTRDLLQVNAVESLIWIRAGHFLQSRDKILQY